MSTFSERLRDHTRRKNIVILDMARKCNVDHSTLYQYLNGKRLPPSQSLVSAFADYLNLSPDEEQELIESFTILKVGKNIYYRRKYVKKFIELLNTSQKQDIPVELKPPSVSGPNGSAVIGKDNLDRVVSNIIASEAKTFGKLRIMCPGQYDFLYSMLCLYGSNLNLQIEHLMCLENHREDRDCYNIKMLCTAASLLKECLSYQLYYFYDNVQAHYNSMSIYPYMLAGETVGLLFSHKLSEGILFTDPDILRLLKATFDECKKKSRPFLSDIPPVETLQELIGSSGISDMTETYILCSCVPFVGPGVNRIWAQLLRNDLPEREKLKAFYLTDNEKLRTLMDQKSTCSFFTREGVADFYIHGRLFDPNRELFYPLTQKTRKKLLEGTIGEIREGRFQAGLLRDGALKMEPDFYLIVTNKSFTNCVLKRKDGSYTALTFQEGTICRSIYDFMSTLKSSGIVQTSEESLQYLESVIAEGGKNRHENPT